MREILHICTAAMLCLSAVADVNLTAPFGAYTIRETRFPDRTFLIADYGAKSEGGRGA